MNKELWLKLLKFIIKILDLILDEREETGQGTREDPQQFLFPMEYLRLTADETADRHKGSLAYDFAGKDTGCDELYAPCDMTVCRIRENRNGEVYFQSTEPVKFRDGSIDYARMLLMHDESAHELYEVGETVRQGDFIYSEGGMGDGNPNKFPNHVHVEVGKGKWKDCKHYQTEYGTYSIENPNNPESLFILPRDCIVLEDGGKNWKYTK